MDEHCDFEVRRGERGDLLSFGFIRAARTLEFSTELQQLFEAASEEPDIPADDIQYV